MQSQGAQTLQIASSHHSNLLSLIFGQQNPQLCFSANITLSLKVLKLTTESSLLAYESYLISTLQLIWDNFCFHSVLPLIFSYWSQKKGKKKKKKGLFYFRSIFRGVIGSQLHYNYACCLMSELHLQSPFCISERHTQFVTDSLFPESSLYVISYCSQV